MSVFDTLSLEERARQLRDPVGAHGLAVANLLASTNRDGNARAVADLGLTNGDQVLEIGCGLGTMAAVVVATKGVRYFGIDPSSTMIDEARKRNSDLIREQVASFHLAAAEEMPFEAGCFTKVFSIGVIHFWRDPVQALVEVKRVARPGASVIMGCLGPERRPSFATIDYGFHLHDADEWRAFGMKAGFSDVTVQTSTLGPPGGPQLIHFAARRA